MSSLITQQQLESHLRGAAARLRGKIDAGDYTLRTLGGDQDFSRFPDQVERMHGWYRDFQDVVKRLRETAEATSVAGEWLVRILNREGLLA